MINSKYAKKALELSNQNYNCAQSVLLSCDLIKADKELLAKLASSLGGGYGMGNLCGAFSGLALALGALYGYDKPESTEQKKLHYAVISKLGEKFKEDAGSLMCSELLDGQRFFKLNEVSKLYWNGRPCAYLIAYAANMLEEYIKNKEA